MLRPGFVAIGLGGVCLFTMLMPSPNAQAGKDDGGIVQGEVLPIDRAQRVQDFLADHPRNQLAFFGNRIERVYGTSFSSGRNPQDSADGFVDQHAGMWGVAPADLMVGDANGKRKPLQRMMYDKATGTYKFIAANYSQIRNGIPVFDSQLVLLMRNEANYPLVLASSSLRDIGTFTVNQQSLKAANSKAATQNILKTAPAGSDLQGGQFVIWAGVENIEAPPTLALQYIVEGGSPSTNDYTKKLVLVNAVTGAILHEQSLVHEVDITGNVSGLATEGWAADFCGDELPTPMPYAKVASGATTVFTDVNGNFVLPNAGSGAVDVTSHMDGLYFDVANHYGLTTPPTAPQESMQITQSVMPPGPVNFVHNQANDNEHVRAEVNAYLHANIARDHILQYNPEYPEISTDVDFNINVSFNLQCNAFYNGSSINFYRAGGSCGNTAFSTVVHHEYGHHLVSSGGSGQGPYGEGMSDCLAVLVSDQPCLGNGFNGPCGTCLRNAQNDCQYQTTGCSSCGSASHSCGRLISGCVWSVRNELFATNPSTYRDILSALTVNSVLLHNGTSITPSITIDFLTLDDDNDDILDGTPHYNEINDGFSAHNMPGPALPPLKFNYPNGQPSFVSPAGTTTMRVEVLPLTATPQPGTGAFFVNTGSGFNLAPVTEVSSNVYDATFPASTCGDNITYFFTAQTATNVQVWSPLGAPNSSFLTFSGFGSDFLLNDNFENNNGWTTTNSGATDGAWERDVPLDCNRGDPSADADGSGQCFLTANGPNPSDPCNTDVDGGTVTLTSPSFDVTGGSPVVSYWRWYSNTFGNSPEADTFVVEFSLNDGATWLNLETVGPNQSSPNPEVDGGWFKKTFNLQYVPGWAPTDSFKVRFIASDLGSGSVVEAGIDGFELYFIDCQSVCVSDITGNSTVDVDDLLAVINSWGACAGCPADIVPPGGNGAVDTDDLLAVINAWGACQ
jgi:hypothetical protein